MRSCSMLYRSCVMPLRTENNSVTIVGPLIEPQAYGIAFPAGSELREAVNRALLELEESGRFGQIRAEWFGSSD